MKNKRLFLLMLVTLILSSGVTASAKAIGESPKEHAFVGGELYYNNIKALKETAYGNDINAGYYKLTDGKMLGYNKLSKQNQMVDVGHILEKIRGKGRIPLDRKFMLISSRFGFRSDPFKLAQKNTSQGGEDKETIVDPETNAPFHAGLDLSAANINGQSIYNFVDGTVKRISRGKSSYGNLVIMENGGFETYYAHLSSIDENLKEGQFITAGHEIGKVGSTGRSTGPHLHMEIVVNNVALNPQVFLHNALEIDEHEEYMENFIFNIVAE